MELGCEGILMVINAAGGFSFKSYENIKFFWDIKLNDISKFHLFRIYLGFVLLLGIE